MKKAIYIFILLVFASQFFACNKTLKSTDMVGIFESQNTNSVLGRTVQIKDASNATICSYSGSCSDVTYTFTTSQLSFSNGKIMRVYDANKIAFSETTKTLNIAYYDANGDGLNDKDHSIPQYFSTTTEYIYIKK